MPEQPSGNIVEEALNAFAAFAKSVQNSEKYVSVLPITFYPDFSGYVGHDVFGVLFHFESVVDLREKLRERGF